MTNTTTIYEYKGWDITIGWMDIDTWWWRASKGQRVVTGESAAGNRISAFNEVREWIDNNDG